MSVEAIRIELLSAMPSRNCLLFLKVLKKFVDRYNVEIDEILDEALEYNSDPELGGVDTFKREYVYAKDCYDFWMFRMREGLMECYIFDSYKFITLEDLIWKSYRLMKYRADEFWRRDRDVGQAEVDELVKRTQQ